MERGARDVSLLWESTSLRSVDQKGLMLCNWLSLLHERLRTSRRKVPISKRADIDSILLDERFSSLR